METWELISSKCKVKRCATFNLCLRPHAPAMAMNNALDSCQPNAGAREFRNFVHPLKRSKKFLRIGHIKTRAIIAHKENSLTLKLGLPKLDVRIQAFAGKFEGIAQQIGEDSLQ
jgi:hypothetical protein